MWTNIYVVVHGSGCSTHRLPKSSQDKDFPRKYLILRIGTTIFDKRKLHKKIPETSDRLQEHGLNPPLNIQEAQLMLTNLRDAFRGQSRSPNIVLFHMLGIVSYCAIVTLSLRRAVFTIFDFKNAVTLKTGLGVRQRHWKCHHVIEHI